MWAYNNSPSLEHHGVKGQRWGVRRYQNADGSLTSAGKKRYGTMDSDKVRKELYGQVKKQRAKQYGKSNRWMSNLGIGENSKAVLDKLHNERINVEKDPRYKEYVKKLNKTRDESEEAALRKQYKDVADRSEALSDGRPYGLRVAAGKEAVNKIGRELATAYAKDLGYNQEAAEFVANAIYSNRQSSGSKAKSNSSAQSYISSKEPSYNHRFAKEDPAPRDGEVVDRLKRHGGRT